MKNYPTDLTESQWQFIENIVDPDKRKRKYSLREIMNTLLYISKSEVQWRMLPKNFAPWESVYYYFRKWKRDGLIKELHDNLVEKIRTRLGKKPIPSVGLIDSQSVKACNLREGEVGYDGRIKIKGRKRRIVVDTLGLVMIIVIHTANIHYSIGAKKVSWALKDKYLNGITKIFADGGYLGELIELARIQLQWILEIVKRTEKHAYKVLPKRWIVERTFAWISFHRRLPESTTAIIHLSMIRLMVNRVSE